MIRNLKRHICFAECNNELTKIRNADATKIKNYIKKTGGILDKCKLKK